MNRCYNSKLLYSSLSRDSLLCCWKRKAPPIQTIFRLGYCWSVLDGRFAIVKTTKIINISTLTRIRIRMVISAFFIARFITIFNVSGNRSACSVDKEMCQLSSYVTDSHQSQKVGIFRLPVPHRAPFLSEKTSD